MSVIIQCGDQISWIMMQEGISFPAAVELLSKRRGISFKPNYYVSDGWYADGDRSEFFDVYEEINDGVRFVVRCESEEDANMICSALNKQTRKP